MTGCVHKVRWSVKRPEDCRFRLSVSHYKDRIVAPDEYTGATAVTPSDQTQILPTKDRLVRDDITVNPAPTEVLSTDHNGTFTPSDGKVGFYQVDVNVDEHKFGYSDDADDFSGGNVLALISHSGERIHTEYYPKLCAEYFIKAAKPVQYRSNEYLFCVMFYDINARAGIQRNANSTTTINILTTNTGYTGSVPIPELYTDVPQIMYTRCAMYGDPFHIATRPLIIFRGYFRDRDRYDVEGGFNFYGLKCYEFGKLVKKYVPWLDKNNVPCVHELVDDEYFYNVGTGNFGYIDLEGNVHDT